MSLLAVIYANGYLEPYRQKGKNLNAHLTFLSTLIASMYLVVTAQNALMFLICWEIMSLSSFFLDGISCGYWILLKGNLDYKYRDVSSEWP